MRSAALVERHTPPRTRLGFYHSKNYLCRDSGKKTGKTVVRTGKNSRVHISFINKLLKCVKIFLDIASFIVLP